MIPAMISTNFVVPTELLAAPFPLLGLGHTRQGSKCARLSTTIADPNAKKQGEASGLTRNSVNGTAANSSPSASPPCVQPGVLRAATLCSLTGLCSRTKVNIVNTNMRCPTCLLDRLAGDNTLTLFPAVSIEDTVRLMSTRSCSYPMVETAPGDLKSVSPPASSWSATPDIITRPFRSPLLRVAGSSKLSCSPSPQQALSPVDDADPHAKSTFLGAASKHGAGLPSPSAGDSASASSAATMSAKGCVATGKFAAPEPLAKLLPQASPGRGAGTCSSRAFRGGCFSGLVSVALNCTRLDQPGMFMPYVDVGSR